MRLTFLSIIALAVTTLASALFFVQTMDEPTGMQGPLLGKYASAWGNALLVEKQPAAPRSPLTNVTIINAAPH